MERFQDWPQRLSRFTHGAMNRPHEWGKHDCAIFAADCVRVMTGVDLMEGFRGRYSSALSAASAIKEAGFDCLGDLVGSILDEVPVRACRRGDVVLVNGSEGEFLGVVIGHTAVGPDQTGLKHVDLSFAQRGFRV